MKTFLLSLTGLTLFTTSSFALLTGTKNIPGDYATLAAAITDLNAQGVGAGGVTLNVVAANAQTAPAGGYVIGDTGSLVLTTASAANPIIVQGNGNTITASAALTVGNLNDAIFKLIGADWVTLQGFTMVENAANIVNVAATNNMTEWGVALLYVTATDGCQNVTIQNNTIDLDRTYANTFGIYSNSTHTAADVITSATATGATGGNNNLKIYTNNITDVNNGVVVVGPTAAADQNDGLDIGGTTAGTANNITNFGTTPTFSAYANVIQSVNGIHVRNTKNYNISRNTINSSNGGMTVSGTLNGIQVPSSSNAPTGTLTQTINNNSISLRPGVVGATIIGINVPSTSVNATTTNNINNNDFNTFGHTVAGGTGAITFILQGGNPLTQTFNSNTFTNMSVNTTGTITFFSFAPSMISGASLSISSNQVVTGFTRTGVGSTTVWSSNASSVAGVTQTMSSNNFSNITLTGASSFTGISNTDGGAPTKTINSNTFNNITVSGGTSGAITAMSVSFIGGTTSSVSSNTITNITGQAAITGLSVGTSGSATTLNVTGNTVTNLISNGTGGTVIGLTCGNPSTTTNTTGNIVNTLSSTGASSTVTGLTITGGVTMNVSGNTINTLSGSGATSPVVNGLSVTSGTTVNVFKNKIYDLSESGAIVTTSPSINGMLFSAGTTVNAYDNLVGDLRTPAASLTDAIRGISVTSATASTTYNVSYNTVYINASSSGANFGTTGIFHTGNATATTAVLNLRDNAIVNNSTAAGTGLVVAFRRALGTAGGLANYGSVSNNNDFYAGAPSATNVIYFDGTSTAQTLAAYKNGVFTAGTITPRDSASVTENPPFLSTAGANANFLHINTTIATQLESGAAPIAGITDDFDSQTRNVSTPDIGADEFTGILLDLNPPTITYSPLGNTNSTAARTLTATITDPSGVPTSGTGLPVLYWKINAGSYTAATATSLGSGQYQFSFGSGVAIGNTVSYYVVAQDGATPPNVGSNPSAGASGFTANPPAASTPPTTPASYTILANISGNFFVGTGQTYGTLTAAVADLNNKFLTGPVKLLLKDSSYTGETFPIVINANPGSSGTNTITIKPDVGVVTNITGSANTALIKLNGASFVTIDGSNASPVSGTDRSLTIENTSATTPSILWFGSLGTTPITNDTVMNCVLRNGVNTSSGVAITDGTTLGNAGFFANITVQNNDIQKAYIGVYSNGGTVPQNGSNLTYTQNNVNTVGVNAIRLAGLYMQGVNGATVSQNIVGNFSNIEGENDTGIWLATGTINATVSNNTVSNLGMTLTTSFAPFGIFDSSGAAASGNNLTGNSVSNITTSGSTAVRGITVVDSGATVQRNNVQGVINNNTGTYGAFGIDLNTGNNNVAKNNFVSNVTHNMSGGAAFSTSFGVFGILVTSGTGHQIADNSVNMYGLYPGTAASSLLSAAFAISSTASTGLDVRDNIFANNITGGTTSIANVSVWLPSGGTSAMNLTWNNNAYYNGTDATTQGLAQVGSTAGTGFYLTSNFNPGAVTPATNFRAYSSTLSAAGTNDNASLASTLAVPFVSANDLHLTSAAVPVNAQGTVIAGITTDFDGETRSTVTPDIGADEVNVAGSLQFSPTGYSVGEAGPTVTLQVTRTGGTDGIVGCTFNTADGTAVAPGDYAAQVNGTLSWVDNDTANKTIVIPITDDGVFELTEAFTTKLTLPTGGATIGANDTATVTITDDDTAPVFAIDDVSHFEGNVGTTTNFVFTITKTGATDVSSSVDYNTANGTAVAPGDYTALSVTTVNFLPAETSKQVTVVVKGDNTYEPDETFTVHLTNAVQATIGDADGTGTIQNDDPAPPPAIFPVTPGSATATDNDYTRVMAAVRDANSGDTIRLEGTFNWTEPNALISWSKGNDGITGTTDDYSILVPADLNGVTFTGESVGAGHPPGVIQGPGDLAGVDLEGVLFFNSVFGSKNQGWTITGVQFLDFDMAIFMQSDQTALDAFNNTHITGNSIRMARDVKEDASQNIAIFFSFGANQLISGNSIDIQGDATSTFPSGPFAADVAMQGQNADGVVYDGLQITNNTIHVLHAQVPTTATSGPEDIIGIWENGSAHSSDITISGNSFTNLDPLNDPALNFQIGFRVNSHSSATTTVGYLNNTVSGANLGFEWLGGTDFSGHSAVLITSNTITGNATGVQVKSHGVADLSFNRIVGNSVNGLNNVDGTVTAINNWWGCNAGPNDGPGDCDTVVGAPAPGVVLPPVVTDPRIVVGASAAPATITPGGTSTVTADMTHNSDGDPLGVVTTVPSMAVGYTATHGTMNPVTDTIVSGTDISLFTSTDSSPAVATVTVDHQAVDAPIGITQPSFTINDVTHAEGNAGTTSFTFTITKTGSTTFSTSVDYATVDGSATSPSDFTAILATTVTFLPADTSKQVTVLVNGDTTIENDEAFTVHLSNSVSATIADADGLGTIINDDVPSFSIDDVTHFEGSGGGTTSYTFTISKTAGAMVNATVDYATVDGTATSPSDFTAIATTTLTFLPADLTKQVTVSVNADNTFEPNEAFTVHLSNPNNATISDADGLGTINNDDASPTPTPTPPPTATPTPTPVPTATPTPGPCSYVYSVTTGNTIVPGTVDIGNHADDGSTVITLPFTYQLYDSSFATVAAGSNGHLTFGTPNDTFGVTCIPVATATYAIGPFWGDQCTDNTPGNCSNLTGLGIFTSTSGTAPNRIFNIEWRTTYYGGSLPLNYEVRLFENPASGAFDVIYGTVNTITGNDSQLSAGVQKGPGAAGFTQVFCDTTGGTAPGVSAGQRYHYTLTPCPTPTPTPTPGGGTPTPTCAPVVTVSGSLDAGDPTQTNRLFRGGIASACGAPNACSTIAGTGFHYDSYSFVNTSGTTACITATTTTACTGSPFIYIGAYVNSFDPANICTNNVGDPGLSPDGITPSVFSFNVPAGATFLIVVSEVTAGSGCSAYSVDVSGLPCGPTPTPGGGTATPSPTPGGGTPTPTATISGTATPTPTPCNAGLGSWTIAANYPAVIESPAVGSDGTFAYSAAGAVGGVASSGFYRYDPVANSWSTLASMPTGLYATRGVYAANTNTFYVFGGYDGTNVLTTTNRYNVGTGTWTTGAPMPAGRYFANMVYYAATGKIYVIGGFDSSFTEANQTWEYDPVANTWNTTRLNIPVAMAGSGASIVGQFVYLAGTWGGGTGSTLHYRYDITGNTWSLMTAVPVAMYAPATGAIGSQIYVIGGGNASRPGGGQTSLTGMRAGPNAPDASYNTTYIYDVAGNSWTTGPNTNVAHSFTAGAAIGSRLIIVGGYNGTADTNTVEVNGVAGCGTPTPTPTPGGPTPTPTATPACTPNYNFTLGTGASIPGTTRIDGVGCDDCLSPLTIPFPVTIYGTSFTTGQVGSNGILAFGTAGNAFAGSCLPVASTTNELMPFYRDQRTDCTAGCGIFTATTGSAPNRVFTVEYKTIYFGETSTTPTNDYEVNFYESGSTAFDYTYALMHTTTQTGRITSIGVQNSATLFKQFACDTSGLTPPVTTGQRLSWTFGGCGTPTPTPTATPPTTPTPTATATPPATPTPTPTATATPPATPTPTPVVGTPTPTATAAATATPSPTATPTSATHAINLSTRMRVQVGNEVGIGGFIVTGNGPKRVIVRAIGPSLSRFGIPDVLADPVLELHGPSGFVTVINDNWRDTQEQEIRDTGIPPTDDLESAIVAVLNPGAYTAIVRGKNNTSGVALIEIYDLDSVGPNGASNSRLANLSTRAFVSTGDNVVIAGFLLSDEVTTDRVIVRGLGPSLAPGTFPASAVLANPTLELRDANGTLIRSNNDWQDNASQAALITAAGLALTNSLESGIAETLPPGLYTALLAGLNNGTGIGLVEIYDLGQ